MATPPTANFSVVRVLAVGILPPLMLWGIFSLWPGSLVTFIILAIPLTTLVASIPLRASEAPVAESLLAALLSALAIGAFAIAQFWSDSGAYTLALAGMPLLAMTPSLILAAREASLASQPHSPPPSSSSGPLSTGWDLACTTSYQPQYSSSPPLPHSARTSGQQLLGPSRRRRRYKSIIFRVLTQQKSVLPFPARRGLS